MKVVFVCTANVFRSVVAEGVCRKFLKEQELDGITTVNSAGIGDSCGNQRPAPILRVFLAERGIDVAEHRSKCLTEETVGTAGLIIPMTRRQERKILTTFPSAEKKTYLLRRFDPLADHPDIKVTWEPVSEMMRKVYDEIYPAVLGLIEAITSGEDPKARDWRFIFTDLASYVTNASAAEAEIKLAELEANARQTTGLCMS